MMAEDKQEAEPIDLNCQKSANGEVSSYDGPFSNPVYKKIALINGEINRMTKEQIRQRLSDLKLDTRCVQCAAP